jgi:NDP-mannose synthase
MRAIVLAGGKGKRLYPYTTVLPKPLMPVAEVPILDIVLRQLASYRFNKITLAVGYLWDLIRAYVGTGERYGVKVDYSLEKKPLGTIGPLSMISGIRETFLVMNGDLLTTVDFNAMLKHHKKSGSLLTLAVKQRKVLVDLGVVKFDKRSRLSSFMEKPVLKYHVGTGICLFEPEALKFIPKNRRFDFPDLVSLFLKKGIQINIYETENYWRDIGRWEDYTAAQKEFPKIKRHIFSKGNKKIG